MAKRDHDGLAAEYVLGTLDQSERAAADRLLREDESFARAVAAWEKRLAPLADAVPTSRPPPHLWQAIERARDADARPAESQARRVEWQLGALRQRLGIWRLTAIAAGAAALLLAAVLIGRLGVPGWGPPVGERYVAMLQSDTGDMAYVVTVEPGTRRVLVRNMGVEAPAQKDFELWIVHRNGTEPLGIVKRSPSMTMPLPRTFQIAKLEHDAKVLICVEPEGGRPTGNPMGPVVFQGQLVRQF